MRIHKITFTALLISSLFACNDDPIDTIPCNTEVTLHVIEDVIDDCKYVLVSNEVDFSMRAINLNDYLDRFIKI